MEDTRDKALEYAQHASEWGALRALVVLIICSIVIVILLVRGMYLHTLPLVALIVLAIYLIYRRSKLAEAFSEERARAEAEKE